MIYLDNKGLEIPDDVVLRIVGFIYFFYLKLKKIFIIFLFMN